MCSHSKFAYLGTLLPGRKALLAYAFVLVALLNSAELRAQQAPAGAIGRVEGADVSVEGGTTQVTASGGYVFNGNSVTVHDGKARLALSVGGEVDICGPAKFTMLESGGAITLALNFGRVHLMLLRGTTMRIYTTTIIATPIDISGEQRDITAGLDMHDSLCVKATSGAIRLEQQFTGEGIIVPQAGEFFLNSGNLVPIAGAPGSCDCTLLHARSMPPPEIPVMGVSSSARLQPPPEPAAPSTATPQPDAETYPNVQLRTLANSYDVHPVAPPARESPQPSVPPESTPEYKIIMPPLGFSASSPSPPADPSLDAALLVRTVHVEPEYEFSGHVEAPRIEQANALTPGQISNTGENKKPGFWAKLKRLFGGA
jgi:hypothetical protein